jgi:hypothetical protein
MNSNPEFSIKLINKSDVTIHNYLSRTKDKIYYDDGIQRRKVWKKKDRVEFIDSVLHNTNTDNIVLAEINSAIQKAYIEKNDDDFEYFKKLSDQGYEYISIDGSNRTECLFERFSKITDWKKASQEDSKLFDSVVSIVEVHFSSKQDLHDIAINRNSGTAWNQQEKRNAVRSFTSNYIRNMSDKYIDVLTKIKGVTMTRMGDRELMSILLTYHQKPTTNIDSSLLDQITVQNDVAERLEFESIIKSWSEVITKIVSTKSVVTKSFSINLFVFLLETQRKFNMKLKKEMISEFSDVYLKLEEDRIQLTVDPVTNLSSQWNELNRGGTKYLEYKFELILCGFCDVYDKYFSVLDPNRLFTEDQKISKWIETKGILESMDGSKRKYRLHQVLNPKYIVGDHKTPHSKGGGTVIENLSLMTREENLLKSDKVLNQ